MDVLDTSALRGISKVDLDRISSRRRIAVSGLSIFEVLCHLDEGTDQKTARSPFEYARSIILKASNLEILHDPLVYQALAIGASSALSYDRLMEPEVIQLTLLALDASTNLEEFYAQKIRLSNGATLGFRDCSTKAREALDSLQDRFLAHWTEIVRSIDALPKLNWREQLTDETLWTVANDCAHNMVKRFKLKETLASSDAWRHVFDVIYCYVGYNVARVSRYLANQGLKTFAPNQNDAEDAYICAYLNAQQHDILVTSDLGTVRALTRALAAYDVHGESDEKALCRVMTTEEYVRAFPGE